MKTDSRSKFKPKELGNLKWSEMSLKERQIALGKTMFNQYKQEAAQKAEQRDAIGMELYENREDFKFMFDKVNKWNDLVTLSKKALTPNAGQIVNELSKSGKELNKLKELGNQNKQPAKENVLDKKVENNNIKGMS